MISSDTGGRLSWTITGSIEYRRRQKGVSSEWADDLKPCYLEGKTFAEAEAILTSEMVALKGRKGARCVHLRAEASHHAPGLQVAAVIDRTWEKGAR